jgi:CubicO group peptidase (beta-lactamase class C family)
MSVSRRSAIPTVLVTVFLLATALPAVAQIESAVDSLRAFVQSELERQNIPGLSIALVLNDQLVWSEGFGFADLETGARTTGSTIYRIGSVSKPVVGTALMQLWEQGKLDLDADIRTYIPQWPEKRWPITVRHLLTHTSGIRHYRGNEFQSATHYDDLVGPLDIFKDDELLFEPGEKFSYSTYAFNLVANIVENVGGLPIEAYMRKHVYAPAWMNSTGLEDWAEIQKGRSRWYERRRDGSFRNAAYVDLSNKYAGGGITATVEDLARLHIAYARGVLLKPETIAAMYTNQKMNDGTVGGYGLSWRVNQFQLPDGMQTRQVHHSGGSVGANTLFWRFPDRGLALAIVANTGANLRSILQGVIRVLHDTGAMDRN